MSRVADPWAHTWALDRNLDIGSDSADVETYTSPAVYTTECEKIFRRSWLLLGRESEIPTPGDFVKRTIYPLSSEVIIARGKDGEVRAFHNVCLHRGARLVREESGKTNLFVCPYHAWSYDTEGQCRAITGPDFFPQLECRSVRLSSVHISLWNGFFFVNMDPEPAETLGEFLGHLGDLYGDFPFHEYGNCLEMVQDINTNWKCFLEAFLEGYHATFVHKKTGPMFLTPENPLNVFYDGRLLNRHSSFLVQSNPDWKPVREVAKFAYATAGVSVVGDSGSQESAAAHQAFMNHRGINPQGIPRFGARLVTIFPMTQFTILTNRYQIQQFWPLDHQRTRFVLRVYTPSAPVSYREEFFQHQLMALTRDLQTEDVAMTELQYQGLKSGGIKKIYFGTNEIGIRHSHRAIQECLRD